jgi:ribosome-associated protein
LKPASRGLFIGRKRRLQHGLRRYRSIHHRSIAGELSMSQTQVFELRGEYVELNQLLKLIGVCHSGGAGKQLVASGMVQVDGQPELRKTAKIHAGQIVSVSGVRIEVQSAAS